MPVHKLIFACALLLAFSCGPSAGTPQMPDYTAAKKVHQEAMTIESQINALVPTVESAIAAGKDTAQLKALLEEFRDYQKMIPEIPGDDHAHDHGHGHDHSHDHSHDVSEMPSAETMLAAQQEYKTKMEELLKRFSSVQ